MLRDVFYYGNKPNVHPREKFAKNLSDARKQANTPDFWIINEFCDYKNFDWDFDFEFLPDEDVWAQDHNNVWPSQHQKDSGTWLCSKNKSDIIVYRNDVEPIKRKNVKSDFWKLYDIVDETRFDFSWHPDPTDPPYIYVWGNQWVSGQYKPTIEYVVPGATEKKYMEQVAFVLPEWDRWVILEDIVKSSFDFSWRPDPKEPDLIFVFGNDQYDAVHMPTIEYHMPNATERKYIINKFQIAKLKPDIKRFEHLEEATLKDYSWVPNPKDPPYIYAWGNQWNKPEDKISIQYVVEGATEYKYMEERAIRKPCMDNWELPNNIDTTEFDFSWEPSPREPAYIYQFGTQWQNDGGPKYLVPNATEIKYVAVQKAKALPSKENWIVPDNIDITEFDFSWHPDATSPPYIYQFGTQWALTGGPKYIVKDATEIKYMDVQLAKALPNKENWVIPADVDSASFDFSWHPYVEDQPYVYVFGTQHQKTGGPKYITPGTTTSSPVKYIDVRILKSKRLPNKSKFKIYDNIKVKSFDWSWHPDDTEQPYIYVFGNNQYPAAIMPTIEYKVPGATQVKYIDNVVATLDINMDNWEIPSELDTTNFDFSWVPNPKDPPYIYEFGTQHQKTGGPRYKVKNAKEVSYVPGSKAIYKPKKKNENWQIPDGLDISDFDFSWHPDSTEKPYIYQFGTQWAVSGGPRFVVPEAKEIKYMDEPIAKMRPNKANWQIPTDIDVDSFDFSWHPYTEDQPYIYQFGTQWQKTGGPRYITPGADEMSPVKYIDRRILKAKRLPNKNNFEVIDNIDVQDFDYSWHPDDTEPPYIYIFGNDQYNAETMPTIKYVVDGAKTKKYVNEVKAKLSPNISNWREILPIDKESFDFSWIPDPNSPPYIYVFGNQWNSAEIEPTIEYVVPGAVDKKYVHDVIAKVLPNKSKWKALLPINTDNFDYSWRPNPKDPPYIYVFGNQYYTAEKMPTITYTVKGAVDKKYVNEVHAKLLPSTKNWVEIIPLDKTKFDFSWIPDPHDPPYIYVFGNQWNSAEIEPTLEYVVPGATEKKYITDKIAYTLPQRDRFEILIPVENFDFSWRPHPNDPPYIYVFGNQWNSAEKEPTIRYKVNNATEFKYINDIVAEVKPNMNLWQIPEGFAVEDFDFSWRPDPYDPAFIYEFATTYSDRGGPRYVVNGATDIKYMSYIKAKLKAESIPKYYIETTLEQLVSWHPTEVFWALQKTINYDNFDFNWRPTNDQQEYLHVFGSPESEKTQTYFVNAALYLQGHTNKNFVQQNIKADSEYLAELFVQPDIFLVDRGNSESQERFDQLKLRFSNIQKTRFLNSWVDTINRCINRSNTELCWILNSELDYSNFDFKYYPNPWQMKMVHVFGTQWSHWGTTFMVNRETFTEDTKYVKIIEHLSNLNFVKERRAVATNNLYDIIVINHGNQECEKVVASLEARANGKKVSVVDYDTSYLNTLKKIVNNLSAKKETFVWITSSICSYGEFDFTYICDPFAKDSLHVFPSDKQKFGDTFLLDVNKAKEHVDTLELLQQYPKVNYNQTLRAKRLPAPVIKTAQDTHVEAIKTEFDFPYAVFQTEELNAIDNEPMNLWTPDSKSILVTSTGGTRIIVPKEAKQYVKDQLYDYPYIKTASKLVASKPLDIVFLSNGEKCADENYEHLLAVTKGLKNRVVRVDGVNGRVDAYQAAVKASETNWAFTVFAKLKVDSKFDWGWQPDRLQIPKHYIFHAKNPVNGLEYGHQGMIAYNKSLTLNNFGEGLDFTLDDPHETVEILSGVATFNTDAYSTWRTAFREVIKLKSDFTDISQERLKIWLTKAKGKFAEDCLRGANDAVEYYNSVQGDIDKLKLSYEWKWLKTYYTKKYK